MDIKTIKKDITILLKEQERDISELHLTREEAEDYLFSDNDCVEKYLTDNNINTDIICVEDLRDLQFKLLNELY